MGQDPDDEHWRVLAPVKNNLTKPPSSLRYTLDEADNGAVRIRYGGESDYSADDLLAPRVNGKQDVVAKAKALLPIVLRGRRVAVSDLKELAEVMGISWRSVERARQDLPINVKREGKAGKRGGGAWFWELQEEVDTAGATSGGLNGDQLPLPENPAFSLQEPAAGLRPSASDGVKAATQDDGFYKHSLTPEQLREYIALRDEGLDWNEARLRLLEEAAR